MANNFHHKSKLPNIETSIFAIMSQLADEENAINLSQGYPDFPSSPKLIQLVNAAMQEGFNQYAPMPGVLELREIISESIFKLHQTYYDPVDEITITAGATQAIYNIISTFIHQDDEVILFAPAYDSYIPSIQLNGGKFIEIEMESPNFTINWDKVKNVITSKTKMIIINTPHNPTGTLLSENDMKQLEQIVENTNIIILSDEVYEHIIFDDEIHQSVARFPKLAERSFKVASFGKTFHTTGWKTGYCAAPKELMLEFRKSHQFTVFSVNHPFQKAIGTFLNQPENYLDLGSFYQKKRDFFLNQIKDSKFSYIPSKGSYFQLLNYATFNNQNDFEFAQDLTKTLKVASIPISVFYSQRTDHKFLRFCFAKSEDTLLKAANILNKIK